MLSVCLIKLLHLALVISLALSVFIPNCLFKEIALVLLVFIFLQYIFNYGKCGLTELEYMVLGEDHYHEGFIYRLVKPVINVPEKYFYNGLFYVHIAWIAILAYQIYYYKCPISKYVF